MLADDLFVLLNTIHLKRMATHDVLTELVGGDAASCAALVARAREAGYLLEVGGSLMLEAAGTEAVLAHYREAHASLASDPAVIAWYDRFEALNAQFIKYVSEWQRGEDAPKALERVARAVERQIAGLGELSQVPRYAHYVRRFERALAAVDGGEVQFVASPLVDSVHNVWFEFHEDILTALGRPRKE
jgi:hypothetical protein